MFKSAYKYHKIYVYMYAHIYVYIYMSYDI